MFNTLKKKGTIAVLGAFAFALSHVASYANTPSLGAIPDVVVTDGDLNKFLGLTLDMNFFSYTNALCILDYLSDDDSTEFKVAFQSMSLFSGAAPSSVLTLGGVEQLGVGGVVPSDSDTWDNFINSATLLSWPYITVRDIYRSPDRTPGTADPVYNLGDPGTPYPDPKDSGGADITDFSHDGTNETLLAWTDDGGTLVDDDPQARLVWLWVADEDNAVSEHFLVYSVNNGCDELSGGFTLLFGSDFDANLNTWFDASGTPGNGLGDVSPKTAPPTSAGFIGGQLDEAYAAGIGYFRYQTTGLSAGEGGDGTFTQRIPAIDPSLIYCGRWSIQFLAHSGGGPTNKTNMPDLRIGSQTGNGNIFNMTLINSTDSLDVAAGASLDGHIPEIGATKVYTQYWSSHTNLPNTDALVIPASNIDARTWAVFFDALDANNGGNEDEGNMNLVKFEVVSIARPADKTGSAAFGGDLVTGFTQNGFSGAMTVIADADIAGGVRLQDLGGGDGSQYILWRRFNATPWVDGVVTRATASLSFPTTADRTNFGAFRMRHNLGFGGIINIVTVNANDQAGGGVSGPYIPRERTHADYIANGADKLVSWLPSFGGPTPDYFVTPGAPDPNDANQDIRNYLLALDLTGPNDIGGSQEEIASNLTVEGVLYETFTGLE